MEGVSNAASSYQDTGMPDCLCLASVPPCSSFSGPERAAHYNNVIHCKCSKENPSLRHACVQGLKTALRQLILLLPPYCLVGIITFGCQVFIHQLGHDIPIATCFQPSASFSKDEVPSYTLTPHAAFLCGDKAPPPLSSMYDACLHTACGMHREICKQFLQRRFASFGYLIPI